MAALEAPRIHRKARSAPNCLEDTDEKRERSHTMGTLSRSSSFRRRSKRRNKVGSRRKSKTPTGDRLSRRNRGNRRVRFKNGVEKKLGPRDVGRNSYKEGT